MADQTSDSEWLLVESVSTNNPVVGQTTAAPVWLVSHSLAPAGQAYWGLKLLAEKAREAKHALRTSEH